MWLPLYALPVVLLTQLPAGPSVVVMGVQARANVAQDLADLTTELLVGELRRLAGGRIIAQREVMTALQLDEIRRSVGGSELQQAVQTGASLDADEVITGTLTRVGNDTLQLSLTRVRVLDASVLGGSTRSFSAASPQTLAQLMPAMAAEVLNVTPSAALPSAPSPVSTAPPVASEERGMPWLSPVMLTGGVGSLLVSGLVGAAALVGLGVFTVTLLQNQQSLREKHQHAFTYPVQMALSAVAYLALGGMMLLPLGFLTGAALLAGGAWLR